MQLKVESVYRTRDGRRVKILRKSRTPWAGWPYTGAVLGGQGELHRFGFDGRVFASEGDEPLDLIQEEPEAEK